ncbi:hypothetical protein UlMin_029326 [Ulmus minor]
MQGSSMERGESETKQLLVKEKVDKINGGLCSSGQNYEGELPCESSSSSSSATFVLVLSTFVAATGSYAFGNASGYSSPTESAIIKDLGLSLAEYSVVGSIITIGGMFGAILSEKIADAIGRRGAMGVSDLFCIAGWLSMAFAKIPAYVAEIAPKNIRGTIMVVKFVTLSCGKAVFFLIGSFVSWRTLALIGEFGAGQAIPSPPRPRHITSRFTFEKIKGHNKIKTPTSTSNQCNQIVSLVVDVIARYFSSTSTLKDISSVLRLRKKISFWRKCNFNT